jgi:hypothetical protein
MDYNRLLDLLKFNLNFRTDGELATWLGLHRSHLSEMRHYKRVLTLSQMNKILKCVDYNTCREILKLMGLKNEQNNPNG